MTSSAASIVRGGTSGGDDRVGDVASNEGVETGEDKGGNECAVN